MASATSAGWVSVAVWLNCVSVLFRLLDFVQAALTLQRAALPYGFRSRRDACNICLEAERGQDGDGLWS